MDEDLALMFPRESSGSRDFYQVVVAMLRRALRLASTSAAGMTLPHRTPAALPTRKKYFVEHLIALREKDPVRWTAPALAHHFGVPLENIQAMIALQAMRAERLEAGEEIDAELDALADDAEEYLDTDEPAPAGATSDGRAETYFDRDAPPTVGLEQLGAEQEAQLIGALVERLAPGGDGLAAAAVRAVEALDAGELRQLRDAVTGKPAAPAADGDERGALLRSLLDALSTGAHRTRRARPAPPRQPPALASPLASPRRRAFGAAQPIRRRGSRPLRPQPLAARRAAHRRANLVVGAHRVVGGAGHRRDQAPRAPAVRTASAGRGR